MTTKLIRFIVLACGLIYWGNYNRAYSISVNTIQTSDTVYIVRTAWGRVSNLYQSRTRLFSKIDDVTQYIYTNLLTRKRHGYSLLEKSKGFPPIIEVLHDFNSVLAAQSNISSQLSLF